MLRLHPDVYYLCRRMAAEWGIIMLGELIFNAGLTVMGVAVIAGICITVMISVGWKKLNAKLDVEYGKKRR